MKKNVTKRALVLSLLSLLLCMSMLVGTTFAWFTDSVTSGKNRIVAGNLDIELKYSKNFDTWTTVEGTEDLVDPDALWEPGRTEVVYLKLSNEGTLVLKYNFAMTVANTIIGKSVAGNDIELSKYLKYDIVPVTEAYDGRDAARAAVESTAKELTAYTDADVMEPGASKTMALVVYMPESVGNEANYRGEAIPTIELGLNLFATQKDAEEDSFGSDYDKYSTTVKNVEELLERLANAVPGEKIYMEPGVYALERTIVIPSGVSLYGAQAGRAAKTWANDANAAKTIITSKGSRVLAILQDSDKAEKATANITIDGIMIDCSKCSVDAETGTDGIYVKKSDGEAMEGIRIVNCAVVNSADDGIDVGNAYGAVIENNYVANVEDTAIRLGNYNGYHYETWAEVTAYVRNNVIENVTCTLNGAIQIENGMGDVVVSGNVIKNVTAGDPTAVGSGAEKASAIHVYDVYEGGEILIEKNTIEAADKGIAIYKYTYNTVMDESWWEGPTSGNDSVTVSNNTISGFKAFGISVTKLNDRKNTIDPIVVVTGNTLTSTATTTDIYTDGSGTFTQTNNTFNDATIQ